MSTVTESIDVDVPVSVAYNQWTQFETFPLFLDSVESVTQLDDAHTHWVVRIAGHKREFDADITEQHPDQRVAWRSADGDNGGVVTFEKLDDTTTRVTAAIDWAPAGPGERVGSALGIDNRALQHDLENFKHFIENRNGETGAWRGEID